MGSDYMGAINTIFRISTSGKWFGHLYLCCALLLAPVALGACATGSKLTDHAFSFDARWDSPDVEVLNYRYGDSKQPGARVQEYSLRDGKIPQAAGINGPMLRGDFLYVKWRIKNTGDVFEDTVDLRSRLPADIAQHRVHFVIKGPQLYVYLISPERKPADWPPNGPRRYDFLKVITIYPDQPKLRESR